MTDDDTRISQPASHTPPAWPPRAPSRAGTTNTPAVHAAPTTARPRARPRPSMPAPAPAGPFEANPIERSNPNPRSRSLALERPRGRAGGGGRCAARDDTQLAPQRRARRVRGEEDGGARARRGPPSAGKEDKEGEGERVGRRAGRLKGQQRRAGRRAGRAGQRGRAVFSRVPLPRGERGPLLVPGTWAPLPPPTHPPPNPPQPRLPGAAARPDGRNPGGRARRAQPDGAAARPAWARRVRRGPRS